MCVTFNSQTNYQDIKSLARVISFAIMCVGFEWFVVCFFSVLEANQRRVRIGGLHYA